MPGTDVKRIGVVGAGQMGQGIAQVASQAGIDVVVIDASLGGSQQTALDALRNGDIAAVGAVVTAGVPRFVGRSRNTPAPIKNIRVAECRLPKDFGPGAH